MATRADGGELGPPLVLVTLHASQSCMEGVQIASGLAVIPYPGYEIVVAACACMRDLTVRAVIGMTLCARQLSVKTPQIKAGPSMVKRHGINPGRCQRIFRTAVLHMAMCTEFEFAMAMDTLILHKLHLGFADKAFLIGRSRKRDMAIGASGLKLRVKSAYRTGHEPFGIQDHQSQEDRRHNDQMMMKESQIHDQ